MQENKPHQNQEGKALNLPEHVRRFFREQAKRTGRPVEDYLGLVGYSGDADRLSREMQQSKEEHLGPETFASPGLSVGRPSFPDEQPPLVSLTVARDRRDVQDALSEYRKEGRRRRWRARILRAYGLDPGGRDAATRLAQLLLDLALDTAVRRYENHSRRVALVTVMLPAELLAIYLGVRRETIWRALKRLRAVGLVDARVWRTTSGGETRAAGTLFAVRLKPGGRARLAYGDFKHPWRDLDGDRAKGRTAWAWVQADQRPSYNVLLAWALGERVAPGEKPPLMPELYDIRDLPGKLPHEVAGMVTALADYLARLLDDRHSRRFYAKLLWRVVYLELKPDALINQVERVRTDAKEGWARKPGALLATRLAA